MYVYIYIYITSILEKSAALSCYSCTSFLGGEHGCIMWIKQDFSGSAGQGFASNARATYHRSKTNEKKQTRKGLILKPRTSIPTQWTQKTEEGHISLPSCLNGSIS